MANFSDFVADGEQEDNIPGINRMWKILSSVFTAEYPAKANTLNGEIAQNILLALPAYFIPAEYKVLLFSKMLDDELYGMPGSQGYRHKAVFEIAGFSAAIQKELMKDINARAVYVFELTDGQLAVVGTSSKGVAMLHKGTSGEFGTGRRGKVINCEEAGYRWPVLPMSEANKTLFLARLTQYIANYSGVLKTMSISTYNNQNVMVMAVDAVNSLTNGMLVSVASPDNKYIEGYGNITNITGTTITVAISYMANFYQLAESTKYKITAVNAVPAEVLYSAAYSGGSKTITVGQSVTFNVYTINSLAVGHQVMLTPVIGGEANTIGYGEITAIAGTNITVLVKSMTNGFTTRNSYEWGIRKV